LVSLNKRNRFDTKVETESPEFPTTSWFRDPAHSPRELFATKSQIRRLKPSFCCLATFSMLAQTEYAVLLCIKHPLWQ